MQLGYHHVETGPTSNFVGNHMTQGAIDLVQAELGHKPAGKLLGAPPLARRQAPPRLAGAVVAAPVPQLPLQEWRDEGAVICLVLQLPESALQGGAGVSTSAEFSAAARSLHVAVTQASPSSKKSHAYSLPALWSEIFPEQSCCRLEIHVASGAEQEPGRPCVGTGPSITLSTSCPVDTIVLTLAKKDPNSVWEKLVADQLVLPGGLPGGDKHPDLAALKRAVRQHRK